METSIAFLRRDAKLFRKNDGDPEQVAERCALSQYPDLMFKQSTAIFWRELSIWCMIKHFLYK